MSELHTVAKKRSGRKETASLPEIHGMLPSVSLLSATADNTSACTIATVHKFHLQILIQFYFNAGMGFGQDYFDLVFVPPIAITNIRVLPKRQAIKSFSNGRNRMETCDPLST